ncbi:kinase-like domain-containing protein [Corynascus similis CBS 632.67]
MWWDDETIERTVTKQFVANKIGSKTAGRLDQPPGFGKDLTDSTYWDWIENKCKRTFLILADIGLPSHIFDLVDGSLDDQDLPFAIDQVARLRLTPSKNDKIERKFYYRQFHYLLRHLHEGTHTRYKDEEVVPVDVVDKKHAVGQGHLIDKVTLPNQPGIVFCRSQIRFSPDHINMDEFMSEIDGLKGVQHEHLLSYWASYTHRGYGYILFTPAPAYSLRSLLTTMPGCLKQLDKKARRRAVMNWIYCLSDTLCFLHSQGLSHGNIRPSTVEFSRENFAFFSGFKPFYMRVLGGVMDDKVFEREAYDYGAPERIPSLPSLSSDSINRTTNDSNNQASLNFDPQAADIFSLGCIILELLSFLFKRQGRPFAAHRAEKHRAVGRGSPFPDASFHDNIEQVESWMTQLATDATEKDDPIFGGVEPILCVVVKMLAFYPSERLKADKVREMIGQILVESCGMPEPHCLSRNRNWSFGSGSARQRSSSRQSTESAGTRSAISTQRRSGSQGEASNRASAGSGGSASLRSIKTLFREPDKGEAASRPRNSSQGSQSSAQEKRLQASIFENTLRLA